MCNRLVEILSHGNSMTEDSDRAALVRENIAALDGPFACERIVEALARLRETTHDHGPSLSRVFARSSVLARKFSRKLVHRNRSYQRHKVDHSQFTVERIGARADEISKALRRFHGLVFEQRTPGIVTIRNGSAAGLVNQPGKADLDVR
jgi:hypothetical protein